MNNQPRCKKPPFHESFGFVQQCASVSLKVMGRLGFNHTAKARVQLKDPRMVRGKLPVIACFKTHWGRLRFQQGGWCDESEVGSQLSTSGG